MEKHLVVSSWQKRMVYATCDTEEEAQAWIRERVADREETGDGAYNYTIRVKDPDVPEEFRIPLENFDALQEKIEKLAKRAAKLKSTPIVMREVRREQEVHKKPGGPRKRWDAETGLLVDDGASKETVVIKDFVIVTIEGEVPKFAGWSFVGTIEHLGPGANIVREVPGSNIPAEYRTSYPSCDHCGKERRRKETFVLLHEDGRYSRVGRQCLRDFLGHSDPEALAAYAEYLFEAMSHAGRAGDEDWDEGGGEGRYRDRFSWLTFLTQTAAVIRKFGFMSRKKSQEIAQREVASPQTTGDRVLDQFMSPKPNWWKDEEHGAPIEERDIALAEKVTQYILAMDVPGANLSSYEWNLVALAKAEVIKGREHGGIVASAITYYEKAMGILAEKQREKELQGKKANAYMGVEGEKITVVVQLTKVIDIEGDWGTTHLHCFEDATGRALRWFTSSERLQVTADDTSKNWWQVTGRIKRLDVYKDVRQTVVSRANCKPCTEAGELLCDQCGERVALPKEIKVSTLNEAARRWYSSYKTPTKTRLCQGCYTAATTEPVAETAGK